MKDWLDNLHRKTDLMFNIMSAIEATICLVPLWLQCPHSLPSKHNNLIVHLPIHNH